MQSYHRPFRSVLYIPGSKARALEKAKTLPVDAIIFDLEDAVAPDEKVSARDLLVRTLSEGGYGPRAQLVRINGMDTEWGADDLAAVMEVGPQAILLPKVGSAADVAAIAAKLDAHPKTARTRIWAMIETPQGILNAGEITAAPRMEGIVMGTNDLAKEIGSRSRAALHTALQTALLAARAAGVVAIDGVYNAFRDEDGLIDECREGRDFGFDGKSLIHPAQVAPTNAAFSPSQDEIETARRQIAAYEEAKANGQGVAVLDGRIVENLHVETARRTLAKISSIAALDAA